MVLSNAFVEAVNNYIILLLEVKVIANKNQINLN